jgi:hypothetical protein
MDHSSLETADDPRDPVDLTGAGRPTIRFVNYHETYSGTSGGGRRWVITATLTGWRLEFRDPGDVRATYAGTHPSVRAAQREASR